MPPVDEILAVRRARELAAGGAGRVIREAAGLSLADVGGAIGRSPSTVMRWEHGECRPSGRAAVAYGRLLLELMQPAFHVPGHERHPAVGAASPSGVPPRNRQRVRASAGP